MYADDAIPYPAMPWFLPSRSVGARSDDDALVEAWHSSVCRGAALWILPEVVHHLSTLVCSQQALLPPVPEPYKFWWGDVSSTGSPSPTQVVHCLLS